MNEFRTELFIDGGVGENIEFLSLSEKDMEQWKEDMELHALSEYYKRKIKILNQRD